MEWPSRKLLKFFEWSLGVLLGGVWLLHRHDGTDHVDATTRPLGLRGVLCEVRCDWSALKQLFDFPMWNHSSYKETVAGRAEIGDVQLLSQRHSHQARQVRKHRPSSQDIRRDWHFQIPSRPRQHQDNFPNPEVAGVDASESLATAWSIPSTSVTFPSPNLPISEGCAEEIPITRS